MKQFTKKYQLWTSADSAYTFTEFDTLQECIEAPKYSSWYITKKVSLAVTEEQENPNQNYGLINSKSIQQPGRVEPIKDERTPEQIAADDLVSKYAAGPIAPLN